MHIIIDSTANVPESLLAAHANLHVVPLTVSVGGKRWQEGRITNRELFDLTIAGGVFPKTSQPSPGEFVRIFEPLVEAAQQVIVIALSGGLSGTVQSARIAAELVGSRHIRIIDSGTTAVGMVRMAERALAEAACGASLDDVAGILENMARNTRTMFVPATLEYLHKGGRIGPAAALLGAVLAIRPVLYLADGKVAVLDKVRTQQKAVARMVAELQKHSPPCIDVVHIEAAAAVAALSETVKKLYPEAQVTVNTAGAVLGAHLGPGLLGLIYQISSGKQE